MATLKEMSHLAQPKLTNVRLAIKVLLIILHFVFIVIIYCFQFAVCRSFEFLPYKHDLNYGVLQLKNVILRSAPGPSSVFVPFFRVNPSFLNTKYFCRSK